MRRLSAAAVILAAVLTAPALAAAPPDMPTFATASDDVSVMLWLRRNTSLRLGQSVVFGPDNVMVITSDIVDAGHPSIHRVGFRQEATRIDFVSRTGGRSVRGAGDVDCATGQVKATSIALYSGSDLRGDQISTQGPDLDWRRPVAGTASALVMQEVCAPRRPAPSPLAAAPPIPPPPPTPPAPRASPAPAPAPPPAPPAAARPAPPAGGQALMAQIGAFSTRSQAEAAWGSISAAFPAEMAGKTARIEPAIVNGTQVYRTSIEGFASEAAARAACAELMARSQACFVRRR